MSKKFEDSEMQAWFVVREWMAGKAPEPSHGDIVDAIRYGVRQWQASKIARLESVASGELAKLAAVVNAVAPAQQVAQTQMKSLRQEAMECKRTLMDARSEIIRIAAACARFQHHYLDELEQDDLKQFGRYAHDLKKIADRMNQS